MIVWVETVGTRCGYNHHVFSSKENVIQYWIDMGLIDSTDKVRDYGNEMVISNPDWNMERSAICEEVDEYYERKDK